MKIVIFNVKYSENLGDGILALCLEKALMLSGEDIEVETVDIAGRHGFGEGRPNRARMMALLQAMPPLLRRIAVELVLSRKLARARPEWEEKIETSDAVVIGGGNLFQDDDLNFPLKIGTLLGCVRRSRRPLAVYAVGASSHWSKTATALFGGIREARLAHISVRDAGAQVNWRKHFPEGPHSDVWPDPGLLTGRLLRPLRKNGDVAVPRAVGICATAPVILRRHSSAGATSASFATAADYRRVIQLLIAQGCDVQLFCNGAQEDQAFAEHILDDSEMRKTRSTDRLVLAERPRRPEELIDIIAGNSVILGHRLHALIVAYSLGIPHVGLSWDSKVEAFFQSVGRSAYFATGPGAAPAQIVDLLIAARSEGIDSARRDAVLAKAFAGVGCMARQLRHQNTQGSDGVQDSTRLVG